MGRIHVIDRRTGETLPGQPSLRLADEGRGEAWMRDEGIWRVGEPSDPPGTVYRSVIVVREPDRTMAS